jgi:hypothetical protein
MTDESLGGRERPACTRRQFLGLVGSGGAAAATAGVAAAEPSVPVEVETEFLGETSEDDHAVRAVVRVAPTAEFGAVREGTLTVRASDRAFLGSEVGTSQRTGGDQVLTRERDQPLTFALDRVEPGETVGVTVHLYPKAEFPDGDLGTVAVQLQRGRNSEVVEAELPVAHAVAPAEVSYGESPAVAPWLAGAGGFGVGALAVGLLATWRRRSIERAVAERLSTIADRATSPGVSDDAEAALSLLGADSNEADPAPGPGPDRSPGAETDGSTSDDETGSDAGESAPLVDLDD